MVKYTTMRLRELFFESPEGSREINEIAQAIVDYFRDNKNLVRAGTEVDLDKIPGLMSRVSPGSTGEQLAATTRVVIVNTKGMAADDPRRTPGGYATPNGVFAPGDHQGVSATKELRTVDPATGRSGLGELYGKGYKHQLGLSAEWLTGQKSTAKISGHTFVHELQHLSDGLRSNGAAFQAYRKIQYNDLATRRAEINKNWSDETLKGNVEAKAKWEARVAQLEAEAAEFIKTLPEINAQRTAVGLSPVGPEDNWAAIQLDAVKKGGWKDSLYGYRDPNMKLMDPITVEPENSKRPPRKVKPNPNMATGWGDAPYMRSTEEINARVAVAFDRINKWMTTEKPYMDMWDSPTKPLTTAERTAFNSRLREVVDWAFKIEQIDDYLKPKTTTPPPGVDPKDWYKGEPATSLGNTVEQSKKELERLKNRAVVMANAEIALEPAKRILTSREANFGERVALALMGRGDLNVEIAKQVILPGWKDVAAHVARQPLHVIAGRVVVLADKELELLIMKKMPYYLKTGLLKSIPLAGYAILAYLVGERLGKGDPTGAALELGTGLAMGSGWGAIVATIPGIAVIMARDLYGETFKNPNTDKMAKWEEDMISDPQGTKERMSYLSDLIEKQMKEGIEQAKQSYEAGKQSAELDRKTNMPITGRQGAQNQRNVVRNWDTPGNPAPSDKERRLNVPAGVLTPPKGYAPTPNTTPGFSAY